ncbi:MAG: segregation/condensation protein A [Bacillota bacterium]|nr:segregation/condensation protein A [Bacillota bacterium]
MAALVLTITLPVFEGPLDLLLYLVEKQELDIYRVDVAAVAEQYLAHLRAMEELDLELASEFFVLAVRLLGLKARALLPSGGLDTAGEQPPAGEDPRTVLIRELMDYRRCRARAIAIGVLAADQGLRFARTPTGLHDGRAVSPDNETLALDVLTRAYRSARVRSLHRVQVIPAEVLTVRRRMVQLLLRLRGGGEETFAAVCRAGSSRREFVVTLLAILELLRRRRLTAAQPGPFADIRLEMRRAASVPRVYRQEALL